MHGLGRLIALPIVLIALALQGLAPAQALAMPRDAFGDPICSASHMGAGGNRHAPGPDRSHDCCAAACALAGLAAGPAAPPAVGRATFAVRIEPATTPSLERRPHLAVSRPNARGPPAPVLPS
jgi:hypothetical protein